MAPSKVPERDHQGGEPMFGRLFTASVLAIAVGGAAHATTLKLSHQWSDGDVRNNFV